MTSSATLQGLGVWQGTSNESYALRRGGIEPAGLTEQSLRHLIKPSSSSPPQSEMASGLEPK